MSKGTSRPASTREPRNTPFVSPVSSSRRAPKLRVRAVKCPVCGAEVDASCHDDGKPREAVHGSRRRMATRKHNAELDTVEPPEPAPVPDGYATCPVCARVVMVLPSGILRGHSYCIGGRKPVNP